MTNPVFLGDDRYHKAEEPYVTVVQVKAYSMITLHVYLTPKPGKSDALRAATVDTWIKAMSAQPGFVRASMLTPYEGVDSEDFEVVTYWETEEFRRAWVERPIHDEALIPIGELAESIDAVVKVVAHSWGD
jgi:heme-degrading monooxygenase HmoA